MNKCDVHYSYTSRVGGDRYLSGWQFSRCSTFWVGGKGDCEITEQSPSMGEHLDRSHRRSLYDSYCIRSGTCSSSVTLVIRIRTPWI